jgi:hypothetical protein
VRRLLTAAAFVTGLALSVTACSGSSPTGPASTDPVQTVAKSADAINTTPSHQTVTTNTAVGNLTVDGDSDPTTKSFTVKISGPAISEVRGIGNDAWVALTGEAKPWAHLDVSKLPDVSPTKSTLDVKSNYLVLFGITSAKEASPGTFECVADLNKAKTAMTTDSQKANVQALIDLAGAKAAALPFRATLDSGHRLVQLSYEVSSDTSGKLSFSAVISNYGKAVPVVKPPAEDVMEATSDMYDRY